MLVWLFTLTVSAQPSTHFLQLSQYSIPANASNPVVLVSASLPNVLLLAWPQNQKVFSSLVTTEGQCVKCDQLLGSCWGPQIERLPSFSVFVAACLTEAGVLVKLISAEGHIQYTDTLKAANPRELRLAGLSNSQVLLTYASHDGDSSGIFSHLVSINGAALGASSRVNRFTQGPQGGALAAEIQGGFLVIWESKQDRWGIYGQYFDYSGKRVGTESMIVNQTGIKPLVLLTTSEKQLLLYAQFSLGNSKICLKDLNQPEIAHEVTGLPAPIWSIQRALLLAVTDDRLLLGLNYKDSAGQDKSLLLAFAPAGCHFTSMLFSAFTGGVAISHMSISNNTVLVVLSNQTAAGFTVSRYTLPSASVCLSWSENTLQFPKWTPKSVPARSVPEVMIAVGGVVLGCLLIVFISLWIRYLFTFPQQLNPDPAFSQGVDMSMSIKSLVQMEEFKLGKSI